MIYIVDRTYSIKSFLEEYDVEKIEFLGDNVFYVPESFMFGKIHSSDPRLKNSIQFMQKTEDFVDLPIVHLIGYYISVVRQIDMKSMESGKKLQLHNYQLVGADLTRKEYWKDWRSIENIEIVEQNIMTLENFLLSLGASKVYISQETLKCSVPAAGFMGLVDPEVIGVLNYKDIFVSKLCINESEYVYLLNLNNDQFAMDCYYAGLLDDDDQEQRSKEDYTDKWNDILGDEEAGAAFWNLD